VQVRGDMPIMVMVMVVIIIQAVIENCSLMGNYQFKLGASILQPKTSVKQIDGELQK
jgi:hypothetical protein